MTEPMSYREHRAYWAARGYRYDWESGQWAETNPRPQAVSGHDEFETWAQAMRTSPREEDDESFEVFLREMKSTARSEMAGRSHQRTRSAPQLLRSIRADIRNLKHEERFWTAQAERDSENRFFSRVDTVASALESEE